MSAQPTALSPSSILLPPFPHCAFISATKNSSDFKNAILFISTFFFILLSLNCASRRVSVCVLYKPMLCSECHCGLAGAIHLCSLSGTQNPLLFITCMLCVLCKFTITLLYVHPQEIHCP